MNPRILTGLCIAALLLALALDLLTPPLLIVAILFNVPIVLSAYMGNPRLTGALVVAALVANAIAGYVNGLQAGGTWGPIVLIDRALEALSIVLVGILGIGIHRGAERSGAAMLLAAQGRRERALREAIDEIRASLSVELVERAIARAAQELCAAESAAVFIGSAGTRWERCFLAKRDADEVVESEERPGAELQSTLVRALEAAEAQIVSGQDALGRLVLDVLGVTSALAAPLIDARRRLGILLVGLDREASEQDLTTVRAFADSAATA
ncbi:MAG: GAF domain-containing protein, partial [Candidatus Eremiobacteraeota bacterium]|nr:GAF domain-containing protein [Candidatus Eremiobacteraeota bacterium]